MYNLYLFEAVYVSHVLSLEKKGLECRSVIFIGYCSLIRALIGRPGDPLPVGPGQALQQGQDSLHTRHASL